MNIVTRTAAATLVVAGVLAATGPIASADNTQVLGMSVFRDIVVDQAHGKVFVSGGSVVAADLAGNVIGAVPGISAARQLTMSPDGDELVVADGDFLTLVDPVTLAVTGHIATGAGSCPDAVAAASGKVFFTYGDCVGASGLGAVDLATKAVSTGLSTGVVPFQAELVTVPGAPSVIAARFDGPNSWDADNLVILDTAGGATPSSTPRLTKTFANGLTDLALTPDGSAVVVAAGASGHNVYSTTDASLLGTYPGSGSSSAVAIRSDGVVATGVFADGADLRFFDPGATTPMRSVDLGRTPNGLDIQPRPGGLAFGAVRAYAVTNTGQLRTFTAGPPAALTIATDKTLYAYGATATVTATMSSPTVNRSISLYATKAGGTRALVAGGTADAVTGKVVFHVPKLTANVKFEALFAGDDDFAPARAVASVKVSAGLSISTSSTSMSGYFHKLAHSPAPVVSVGVLPVKPTTTCVKFVAQEYRSGAWRSFGSIACPKRSTSTGRFGVTMYDFPPHDRLRVQVVYPLTAQNEKTTSKWYYILFV